MMAVVCLQTKEFNGVELMEFYKVTLRESCVLNTVWFSYSRLIYRSEACALLKLSRIES